MDSESGIDSPSTAACISAEVLSPVADALGVLADLVSTVRGKLAGASIAKSDRGTLLFNGRAWDLFASGLHRELPGLVVMQPAREDSKPIRFVMTAT
jgi:hypothetical protein